MKDYYAAVVKEPDQSLTQEEIYHQLADRQRVLKENVELERTAKALVQENEQLAQHLQTLQVELQTQQQQAVSWRQKYQAMTAQLREIPLTQVAHELGLDPDPKDRHKWRNKDHILNITGSKFYDFKQMKGGGGAIDLVMQLERCNFGEAVGWLKDRLGDSETLQTTTRQIEQVIAEKPRQLFVPPERREENWQPVKAYLTQSRKLPVAVVEKLHQQGLLYADGSQNAVFLRRSLKGEVVGASLRGTAGKHNSFKGLAYGTRRSQGWFYVESQQPGPAQQVVLVESAIDALSYQVLHPAQEKTLYLSTDGAGYVPLEQLKQVPKVVIAFDQDSTGEEMTQRLMHALPQSSYHRPTQKDWNEDLQTHVRQLQQRLEEELVKQQTQQQRKQRGFSL